MNEDVVEAPQNPPQSGWRRERSGESLPEVHGSLVVPPNASFWRKLLAFSGPGYLVAVGYMDPGNWATDLEGGSRFGYLLLSVILLSNLLAILLQSLSLRLGIVTGRDLAQACRDAYSKPVAIFLWIGCEIAIAACDLAEVIGSAIALYLLFHLPLIYGVALTSLDVIVLLALQNKGFRMLESIVITLMGTIALCFAAELFFSRPDYAAVFSGFIPRAEIVTDSTNHFSKLYIAIGILGATVMPHNLYLHSSIVQTRKYEQTAGGKREAIKFASLDSTLALTFALFINAAILIVAAAAFHGRGYTDVTGIERAHELLTPLLTKVSPAFGASLASTLFAVALLGSGQNSTLTGTLAGQIVMEGFLDLRMRPWLRRLITRGIAIVPAIVVTAMYGNRGVDKLLIFSQVVLSMQLSFAVFPLVMFTSDKRKMGEFVNPQWLKIVAWIAAVVIAGLNVWLLWQTAQGK